ncbi:ret finger protein-like 4B [Arvicanthis niloticus]|uniref:ret finger protein-like 4B n=1 Tax=Arvicanthis niloticus TaxID=61156 RepID=UPI001486D40A|nr:ret finger protein-like 4B [Arvicanthis niloticus]
MRKENFDSIHHHVRVSQNNFLKNTLEMEIICAVCLDIYSDPVYLSCGHIFCIECSKKWMARKEDSIMTCPMCRKEQKRPIKYDGVMRELVILLKQHGPLLKQHEGQITRLLGLVSEDTAPAAKTGDSSLELSNDLRSVCNGKPGHNLVEDPRRFTPSACVMDSSQSFSVCPWDVDVEMEKEQAPGICKETGGGTSIFSVNTTPNLLLGENTRGINFISERHHRSPGPCQEGISSLAPTMEETKSEMEEAMTSPMSTILSAPWSSFCCSKRPVEGKSEYLTLGSSLITSFQKASLPEEDWRTKDLVDLKVSE